MKDNDDKTDGPRKADVPPAAERGADQIRRAIETAETHRKGLTLVKGGKTGNKPDASRSAKRVDGKSSKGRSTKMARADRWVAELKEELELWHTPTGEPYATLPVGSHRENWPINSERFRQRLNWRAMEREERLIGKLEIEKICAALAAVALFRGPQHEVWTRVGQHAGSLFIDLGRDDWCCVEIPPADMASDRPHWVLRDTAPIKFVRRPSMLPMAKPRPGGNIDLLRPFLNVETEGDFQLIVGWLFACLRARGPYPILVINGTQGSGKSNMLKVLCRLVDPTQAPERNLPKDERDLFVATRSSHLQTFDNLSGISNSMADALCRIATGGGYSARALHTDDQQHIMQACKPVLLNGIPDLTRRGDVADRSIVVTAARLTPERRRPEEEFWEEFQDSEPLILGVLFDAMAYGLATYRDTAAPAVRMADAARMMAAAGKALGWEHSSIATLLSSNRLQAIESVIDANPFALALLALLGEQPQWRGSTSELLKILTDRADERTRRARAWPTSPSGARAALDRIKDALEANGFTFERGREANNEKRFIQFMPFTHRD